MRRDGDEWVRLDAADVDGDRTWIEGRVSRRSEMRIGSFPEYCEYVDEAEDE